MFKKTLTYLLLISLIFSFLPLMAQAESGSFDQTIFDLATDTDFSIVVNAQDLNEINNVTIVLKYNPEIITYLDFSAGTLMSPTDPFLTASFVSDVNPTTRLLTIGIAANGMLASVSGSGELVTVNFKTNTVDGSTDIAMESLTITPTAFMAPSIDGDIANPITVTVTSPDTTAPVRTNASPSGVLVHDTTETLISINTDEDAICHYTDTADTLFADSIEMTTTGTTSHAVLVNGLSAGNTYNYYIRCSDNEGNINDDDYLVSFSTDVAPIPTPELSFAQTSYTDIDNNTNIDLVLNASDLNEVSSVDVILEYNPEVITYLDFSPSGLMAPLFFSTTTTSSISANLEQLTMTVTTDMFDSISGSGELATLTFVTNENGGATDVVMTNFTITPTAFMAPEVIGDTGINATITVITPDTTAPVRTNASPSGVLVHDTTETLISINTDEDAICHYIDTADTLFADSIEMTTTGSTTHTVLIEGLEAGNTYNYYIRCSDVAGNANTDDYAVSFSLDMTPVVIPTPVPEPIIVPTPTSSGGGNGYYVLMLEKKQKKNSSSSNIVDSKAVEDNSKESGESEKVEVLGFSQFTDGSLIRANDNKIYIIKGEYKEYINSLEKLFQYSGQTIFDVSDEELGQYKTRNYSNGDLLREKDDVKIFNIVNNELKQILSLEELRKDFAGQEIFNITKEEMALYGKKD